MDDKVLQHIEEALNEVRALFMKAATRIEAIKPGNKIPATTLAEELAKEQGMTGPQIYPIIKLVLDDYPGVLIRRGAHGGIFRPVAGTKIVEQPVLDEPTIDADTGGQPQNGDETAGNT